MFGVAVVAQTPSGARRVVRLEGRDPYGLTAAIWTADEARALAMAGRLETGMVHVNDQNINDEPQVPFGGVKASGIGRDGGDWSFEFYMEQKHIGFATGQHKISRLGMS